MSPDLQNLDGLSALHQVILALHDYIGFMLLSTSKMVDFFRTFENLLLLENQFVYSINHLIGKFSYITKF